MRALINIQSIWRGKLTRQKPPKVLNNFLSRRRIFLEILETEETYVHGLHCLTDIYLPGLQSLPEEVLAPEIINQIFSNIKIIKSVNTLILKQLQERNRCWFFSGEMVGDIFDKFAAFLRNYTDYTLKYNNAYIAFSEASKEYEVATMLQECRNHPDCNYQALNSFLITPIQRITRYVILLQDLRKHTPENHPGCEDLDRALTSVSEVADYVNEKKRQAENLHAVTVISNRLNGWKSDEVLALPHRQVIRQGPAMGAELKDLDHKTLKGLDWRNRYLFLLNDLILFTKVTSAGILGRIKGSDMLDAPLTLEELENNDDISFKFDSLIRIKSAIILDLYDNEDRNIYSLGIKKWNAEDENMVVVAFQTLHDKYDWMISIDDVISEKLGAIKSHMDIPKHIDMENDYEAVIFEGNLLKQGRKNIQWKPIYCILQGNVLKYYASDLDYRSGLEPSRMINILSSSITCWPVADRPNCMQLRTYNRTYYLAADSNIIRMEWIANIRMAVRIFLKQEKLRLIEAASNDVVDSTIDSSRRKSAKYKKKGKTRRILKLNKRNKSLRGAKKQGVLYIRGKRYKLKKARVFLKGRSLIIINEKDKRLDIDLLLVRQVSTEPLMYTLKGKVYYYVELVTSESREEIYSQDIDELNEWIECINRTGYKLKKKRNR
eukprot:TRINITY_DN4620_c0_g1_i2.p1 TRINITY_DN4620_c0_g1~~TRINITY_DN4620_c0_g1_i2.p1  ORF type:complete len:663 (+),score=131.33 TRINITY_DN4620_c0_g1_i2:1401-3389(+)